MPQKKNADQLRSHRWFGASDLRSFGHRSRATDLLERAREIAVRIEAVLMESIESK